MEKFDTTKPPPPPPNRDIKQGFFGRRVGETEESKQRQAEYRDRLEEYGAELRRMEHGV